VEEIVENRISIASDFKEGSEFFWSFKTASKGDSLDQEEDLNKHIEVPEQLINENEKDFVFSRQNIMNLINELEQETEGWS